MQIKLVVVVGVVVKVDLHAAICRLALSASINRSESVYVQCKHCTCIF